VSIVVFVMLGSVPEGIPAIVLFGPLPFPIARQLGIHDVHYAMVVILSMAIRPAAAAATVAGVLFAVLPSSKIS